MMKRIIYNEKMRVNEQSTNLYHILLEIKASTILHFYHMLDFFRQNATVSLHHSTLLKT